MASAATGVVPTRPPGRERTYKQRAPAPELQFMDTQSQEHPKVPDRPARVQVEQIRKLQQAEHLGEYNIWYGRYSGERSFEKSGKASTRCVLELDAGLTRADYTNPGASLCLHFARGGCINGKDCTYRHCAPTPEDETNTDAPHDVFGRNRHGSFRDDMGGVGSWNKECKTLYIGQLCATPPEPQITETLARHFGEWGVLESVRVLKAKGCGFVTYKLRCAAEFAKEAMADQGLDHDEQLNVRWAYDDPNPRAQAAVLRNHAQQMLSAMDAKGHLASVDATAEDAYPAEHAWDAMPDEGGEPDAKRQHVGDGHEGEYGGAGAGAAPMTREQAEYAAQLAEWQQAQQAWQEQQAAQAAAAREQMESSLSQLDKVLGAIDGGGAVESGGGGAADGAADGAASADPLAELYSSIAAAKGGDAAGGSAAEGGAAAGGAATGAQPAQALEAELPPGVWQSKVPAPWMEYQDPTTGHAYYVNSQTGASQWARPV